MVAVQLVKTAKVEGKLKPLLHQHITVMLKNPAPDTEHHQAPLFAWVTGIASTTHQTESTNRGVHTPTTNQMDVAKAQGADATTHQTEFPKEPGTAATTHQTELTKKRVPVRTTHQMDVKAHGNAATTHPMEFVKEHGTAANTQLEVAKEHKTGAMTVRAFYAGLGDGRGDIASGLVVPEKRAHGPFSADELSHFYGHLKKRIKLGKVETTGTSEFTVQYRYAASARDCNGRAVVKTVTLSGKTYIKSINALDRC